MKFIDALNLLGVRASFKQESKHKRKQWSHVESLTGAALETWLGQKCTALKKATIRTESTHQQQQAKIKSYDVAKQIILDEFPDTKALKTTSALSKAKDQRFTGKERPAIAQASSAKDKAKLAQAIAQLPKKLRKYHTQGILKGLSEYKDPSDYAKDLNEVFRLCDNDAIFMGQLIETWSRAEISISPSLLKNIKTCSEHISKEAKQERQRPRNKTKRSRNKSMLLGLQKLQPQRPAKSAPFLFRPEQCNKLSHYLEAMRALADKQLLYPACERIVCLAINAAMPRELREKRQERFRKQRYQVAVDTLDQWKRQGVPLEDEAVFARFREDFFSRWNLEATRERCDEMTAQLVRLYALKGRYDKTECGQFFSLDMIERDLYVCRRELEHWLKGANLYTTNNDLLSTRMQAMYVEEMSSLLQTLKQLQQAKIPLSRHLIACFPSFKAGYQQKMRVLHEAKLDVSEGNIKAMERYNAAYENNKHTQENLLAFLKKLQPLQGKLQYFTFPSYDHILSDFDGDCDTLIKVLLGLERKGRLSEAAFRIVCQAGKDIDAATSLLNVLYSKSVTGQNLQVLREVLTFYRLREKPEPEVYKSRFAWLQKNYNQWGTGKTWGKESILNVLRRNVSKEEKQQSAKHETSEDINFQGGRAASVLKEGKKTEARTEKKSKRDQKTGSSSKREQLTDIAAKITVITGSKEQKVVLPSHFNNLQKKSLLQTLGYAHQKLKGAAFNIRLQRLAQHWLEKAEASAEQNAVVVDVMEKLIDMLGDHDENLLKQLPSALLKDLKARPILQGRQGGNVLLFDRTQQYIKIHQALGNQQLLESEQEALFGQWECGGRFLEGLVALLPFAQHIKNVIMPSNNSDYLEFFDTFNKGDKDAFAKKIVELAQKGSLTKASLKSLYSTRASSGQAKNVVKSKSARGSQQEQKEREHKKGRKGETILDKAKEACLEKVPSADKDMLRSVLSRSQIQSDLQALILFKRLIDILCRYQKAIPLSRTVFSQAEQLVSQGAFQSSTATSQIKAMVRYLATAEGLVEEMDARAQHLKKGIHRWTIGKKRKAESIEQAINHLKKRIGQVWHEKVSKPNQKTHQEILNNFLVYRGGDSSKSLEDAMDHRRVFPVKQTDTRRVFEQAKESMSQTVASAVTIESRKPFFKP